MKCGPLFTILPQSRESLWGNLESFLMEWLAGWQVSTADERTWGLILPTAMIEFYAKCDAELSDGQRTILSPRNLFVIEEELGVTFEEEIVIFAVEDYCNWGIPRSRCNDENPNVYCVIDGGYYEWEQSFAEFIIGIVFRAVILGSSLSFSIADGEDALWDELIGKYTAWTRLVDEAGYGVQGHFEGDGIIGFRSDDRIQIAMKRDFWQEIMKDDATDSLLRTKILQERIG